MSRSGKLPNGPEFQKMKRMERERGKRCRRIRKGFLGEKDRIRKGMEKKNSM